MNEELWKAVNILKEGGIVIFPTDTAFGIGCKVSDQKAVEKLYTIRKRPQTQAASLLVDTIAMGQKYVQKIHQDVIDNLIEKYWPGALTIVLQSRVDTIPSLVRGGGSTVGLRIPNHPVTRALIQELGEAILGPSANFHGQKTPYSINDLDKEFVKQVDFVVKGECKIGSVSTVIDCSRHPWQIVRQGAVEIPKTLLV